jgi:hypothetical protein
MRSSAWALSLIAAIVLFSGYKLLAHIAATPTANPTVLSRPTSTNTTPTIPTVENPLLEAEKSDVSRWFPGNCFAEIYMTNPSFGGKMIGSCKSKVVEAVKAETGYTLTNSDFSAAQVIAHFKVVYGRDGPWIQ